MAGLAFRFSLVAMIDRKHVLRKLGRIPAAGFVAVFACQAKESQVYFRFKVTILTLRWCLLVELVDMAGLAFDLEMAPIQGEYSLVIKIPHPVHTVMALEAAAAQLNLVLNHKILVIECVAPEAGFQ